VRGLNLLDFEIFSFTCFTSFGYSFVLLLSDTSAGPIYEEGSSESAKEGRLDTDMTTVPSCGRHVHAYRCWCLVSGVSLHGKSLYKKQMWQGLLQVSVSRVGWQKPVQNTLNLAGKVCFECLPYQDT